MNNKKELLNEVSIYKKEALEKIKEIDIILNDKKQLEEEYVRRNKNLPEYNKIFSLAHLSEILTRQRKKIMNKIEQENKILDPGYYVKVKNELEEQLDLLSHIDLGNEKEKKKKEYGIKLQRVIIDCLEIKIKKADKKEEILDLIYKFRYYNFIYLNENILIKDEPKLQDKKNRIEKLLIQKAIKEKIVLDITKDENVNIEILKILLESRIINFEKVVIEIKEENEMVIYIYDGDILEKKISIKEITKKDILVKKEKKIKLII